MSLTQTYRVASTARSKLGMEAMRPDHNLRLLVGHANLLDTLMIDLQNAEREQEAWFNQTIRNSRREEPKHVQWIDTVAEEQDIYDEDESSDSDSDSEEETSTYYSTPRRRSVSPPPPVRVSAMEVEDDEDEDFEDFDSDSEELALERVPSRTPELVHEDSDSDDEPTPPSPPTLTIQFNTKVHDFASVPFFSPIDEDLITVNTAPMISAC